jgi:hypothetical protein
MPAALVSPDFKKMLVSLSTKGESANSLVMVNNWRGKEKATEASASPILL